MFKFILLFFCASFAQAAGQDLPQNHQLLDLEVGGSNYVFSDVGDYIGSWTEEVWGSGVLKPAVAAYHINPEEVERQLRAMRAQGQEQIALMIWFSIFMPGQENIVWDKHMINATGGQWNSQMKQNLYNLLQKIDSLGFKKVQLRFAQQWLSDPHEWDQWYETRYTQNKSFILQGRSIALKALENSNVEILFDLGAEQGGFRKGQSSSYTKRLWQEYVQEFGSDDSYGFSFATTADRVERMWKIYQEVGVFPKLLALDVYGKEEGEIFNTLKAVHQVMQRFGHQSIPVLIQETYYNDFVSANEFIQARNELGMNIFAVLQWPFTREGHRRGERHISVQVPERLDAYMFLSQ